MTEEAKGEEKPSPGVADSSKVLSPKPSLPPQRDLGEVELKIAMAVESRLIQVLRRETTDPYAGLPADDVLARLNERFPEANFPERMMRRLEVEQAQRHARELRVDEIDLYAAETERLNSEGERELNRSWGRRAERIVIFLVAVGLLCLFTGHPEIAGIVLGTTLVGVVGSFLAQQVRQGK